ncbi:MAG: glycerate kinase [Deltaproteobacteria bacterium]|nr:glycerate kinase [Deltaproteobacteria bacterium]MBW2120383.1 glycerate kinase [Deltaproteobacteria bacterium]
MALQIIESALEASNPYHAAKSLVRLEGDRLTVGPLVYDLSKGGRIYVIGTGKATYPIARALEEILGDRISEGLVVLKRGQAASLDRIRIIEASHPIPDRNGLRGAREMMKLAEKAGKGDIVFACITGGSSALLPMPADSVRLSEKKKVNRLLLSSGASIFEINAVRKHLSRIKGGRLGLAVFPAELINLTVSDVIGDQLDYITDPTVPDTSTFEDARRCLEKYGLLKKVPPSVRAYLAAGGPREETPKDYGGMPCHSFILVPGDSACHGAVTAAKSLGLEPVVLSTMFDGESRELGRNFAAIGKEIRRSGGFVNPPCVLIGGGETTVTLRRNFGKGGPNQEFVVGAVLGMEGQEGFAVAGLDTDGTDGPTPAAGAIADASTIDRARLKGIDLYRSLEDHEVLSALMSLGDALVTGHTGTNVNDLKFSILV